MSALLGGFEGDPHKADTEVGDCAVGNAPLVIVVVDDRSQPRNDVARDPIIVLAFRRRRKPKRRPEWDGNRARIDVAPVPMALVGDKKHARRTRSIGIVWKRIDRRTRDINKDGMI